MYNLPKHTIKHIKRVYQCLHYFIMVKHIIKMHQSQLLGGFFQQAKKKRSKQIDKLKVFSALTERTKRLRLHRLIWKDLYESLLRIQGNS